MKVVNPKVVFLQRKNSHLGAERLCFGTHSVRRTFGKARLACLSPIIMYFCFWSMFSLVDDDIPKIELAASSVCGGRPGFRWLLEAIFYECDPSAEDPGQRAGSP